MNKQQQVRDFLENKAKEKGFSLNSLSLKLGKNSTYLFHFVKRNSPKRLDENTRRKLATILDVPEQNLCDFPLPSSLIQDKLSTISNLFTFGKSKETELIAIDVIDMGGEKKGKFEQVKQNVIGQEFMTKEVLQTYTSAKHENIKIVRVTGDAMAPTIANGDVVWIDQMHSIPSTDGIYLINVNNDVLLRRLQLNPFDGSVEVLADNKIYRSFTINDIKALNICGKVVVISHKLN